jgi:hypothetical protein
MITGISKPFDWMTQTGIRLLGNYGRLANTENISEEGSGKSNF